MASKPWQNQASGRGHWSSGLGRGMGRGRGCFQNSNTNYSTGKRMPTQVDKTFPLHKAVEYKNVHKVKILLPSTKYINEKNDKGTTVLLLACQHVDNQDILDLLLTRDDINPSLQNTDGFNALHMLAFKGNLPGLMKLHKKFPKLDIDAETDKKNTPLIMAAKMCNVDVIEYLISKDAYVKHRNNKHFTALHYAANNGCNEGAQMLIDAGADIDAQDNYGFTPLMKACKWSFFETCEILLRNGANVALGSKTETTALSSSCYHDDVQMMELILSYGADVNYPGPYSVALFECARRGSVECAKELLKSDVNVTGRNKQGRTAYSIAQYWKHNAVVELLRELI